MTQDSLTFFDDFIDEKGKMFDEGQEICLLATFCNLSVNFLG